MSDFSEWFEKNVGKIDDGGLVDWGTKVGTMLWSGPEEWWGGGRWIDTSPVKLFQVRDLYETYSSSFEGGRWYSDRLGGKEFDKAYGGGAWMTERLGIKPDEPLKVMSNALTTDGTDDGNGGGNGNGNGSGDKNKLSEERARRDAIRRMLAGRYGRAETNLTGGSGYGEGKARGLGGY